MGKDSKISVTALLFLSITLILISCAGSGGGSSPVPVATPPLITGELDSFPTGSVPPGLYPSDYNSMVSIYVIDGNSGDAITNAAVTMNGVTLTYNDANQDYEGYLMVTPGEVVTLNVTVGAATYTVSSSQFTSYPIISAPLSGATWPVPNANIIMWSGGAPMTNALSYGLGILDANDPTGNYVWPTNTDNSLQLASLSTTSYSIPANTMNPGSYYVIVGMAQDVLIPNAAASSLLILSGLNYAPVTVTTPVILASGLDGPYNIAVDSTSVYWTEATGGTIKKVGLNGGAVTTLASGQTDPFDIVVDSTNVYWDNGFYPDGSVNKVALNGGTVTTLASGLGGPFALAVDSTSVYWSQGGAGTGTVNKVGLDGGTVTTLVSELSNPLYIAIDPTSVYWTENGPSENLTKVGLNGGAVISLASGLSYPSSIAVDSTSVYWTEITGVAGGAIKKVGLNGGTVTILVPDLDYPTSMAIDSTNVYWTESGGNVKKVGLNGGVVTTLATGLIFPQGIAVDSTSVYWTEYDGGTVKKIAK